MNLKFIPVALAFLMATAFNASAALITSTGTKPSVGNGNSGRPYEIWTAEELRWFVHYENTRHWYPNDYAKLMCDIDLSEICGPDKGSWIPLGYAEEDGAEGYFDGYIDGNCRKISGLYIDGSDFHKHSKIGFMGDIKNAKVYNLTIEGEITNPTRYTGGFAGYTYADYTTLRGCVSLVDFTGTASMACEVGGIIGHVGYNHIYIDHCIYDGDMSQLTGHGQTVGGIGGCFPMGLMTNWPLSYCVSNTHCGLPMIGLFDLGSYYTPKISHCISDGRIFNLLYINDKYGLGEPMQFENMLYGGDIPYNLYLYNYGRVPVMTHCAQIDIEDLASGKACYDINQHSSELFCQNLGSNPDAVPYPPIAYDPSREHNVVHRYANYTDCTNFYYTYANEGMDNVENRKHVYNDGETICSVCHSAANPDYNITKDGDYYLLSDASEVRWFWALVNDSGELDAKARLTADIEMDEGELTPIKVFSGEIDGQGYMLKNVNICSKNETAGLVGALQNGGSIHDLTISGSISGINCLYIGGFAGIVNSGAELYNLRNDCTIKSCYDNFTFAPFYLGGIAGFVKGGLHHCINNGTVIDSSSNWGNKSLYIAGVAGSIAAGGNFSWLVNNAIVGSENIYNGAGSAVANYSGSTPEGLYYVEIDNPGLTYFYSKKASTGAVAISDRRDVGSGKLCYMLNHSDDNETLAFGQTIGTDYVPYPGVGETHKQVYNKKRYYNCTNYYDYSNFDYDGAPTSSHEYNSDGYCTLCYHADVPQDEHDIYQISSADEWNKFAKSVNAAYSNGALGCFASAALTADIALDASTFTSVENLWGNLHGNGYTVTFSNDPAHAYELIKNVGSTASVLNLNVRMTGSSNAIIADNKGKVTECTATGGQIYTANFGVVTDCYADHAFYIAAAGYLQRCLQCVETNGEKQYTVLTKTNGTAECSVKTMFTQPQEETGELAYYISHLDKNQPCVWGEELGKDTHPKPCYGQTPTSGTFVTRLTTYSVEHPEGVVEYMNAGMALEAAPGCFKVCDDIEPWATRPAYNFIVDNGDGTYTAEHINIDPTVQNYLPLEVQAGKLTFKEADNEGNLVSKDYGFGEILSLVFPVVMPVDNVNGHVHVFDGYDDLNNTLVFTSSLDADGCEIPANIPVLVKTYGGSLLNADLTDVTVMPMKEVGYNELENVRHFTNYQQQTLPSGKAAEDGAYVLYYVLDGDKATLITADANTVGQFNAYFRLPYVANSFTQSELSVALVEDRELKTSRLIERDIFSIPYGAIDEGGEWEKIPHLGEQNIFYGNDITKDIYANISAYDFLYIHGTPSQKYQFYFNGSEATDVVIDGDGDAFIDLDEHRVGIGDVYLRGIRLAEGETVPADAFAKLYKYMEEGLVLYGYGDFSDELKGYPFYDATGVKCGITLNLDNPNAIVVGGPNVKGVYNRIVKTSDVMQGFTAEQLRLTDGGDFCYDYSVKCPDVKFTREEISDEERYVTFVLPFAAKGVKGMYEYVDCDGDNVYFNTPEDGVIDAYLPIVIDMQEYGASTVTITGEDFLALSPNGVFNVTPAPSSKFDMRFGFVTRAQENVPVDNAEVADYNLYAFSLETYKFERLTDEFSVKPFRAFFMLPTSSAAKSKGLAAPAYATDALNIVIDGEEIGASSGIGASAIDGGQGEGTSYNVLGIPVGPDYRGIIIRDGKKILNR